MEKVFVDSRIDVREYTRKWKKRKEYTLILRMNDNSTWKFSQGKRKYWNVLKDINNKGKSFKFYLPKNRVENSNPPRVEIDGKLIYGFDEGLNFKYIFLTITAILTIISGRKIYLEEIMKENEKIKTEENIKV